MAKTKLPRHIKGYTLYAEHVKAWLPVRSVLLYASPGVLPNTVWAAADWIGRKQLVNSDMPPTGALRRANTEPTKEKPSLPTHTT
ncbi:MAG: hypothetical protein AAF542_25925 [Pseudomonadota bacterium]